jgi:hypothetical protein
MTWPAWRPVRSGVRLRLVNAALGAWLVVSTFLWPHVGSTGFSTWLVGLLVLASALSAIWVPQARWGSFVLGLWLFFSAFTLVHARRPTVLHDAVVGILIVAISLVPGRPGIPPERVEA